MSFKKEKCLCPYCGFVIDYDMPFCQSCKIEFIICKNCGGVMRKEAEICPHCGSKKKGKNG